MQSDCCGTWHQAWLLMHWKFSKVLEVGCILDIYTIRYLKDTLSTSPFWKKERITILRNYLKYIHRYLAYVIAPWCFVLIASFDMRHSYVSINPCNRKICGKVKFCIILRRKHFCCRCASHKDVTFFICNVSLVLHHIVEWILVRNCQYSHDDIFALLFLSWS